MTFQFDSRTLRLRLIQLEYQNLSPDVLIEKIKRIYLEEVGEPLVGDLAVFNSSDSVQLKNNPSGYNGTAIAFTPKGEMPELYVISQGTTDIIDWEYNLTGIFAGKSNAQAASAVRFLNESVEKLTPGDDPKIIGFSHSLAHNNNAVAQLTYGVFDDVYSVNGAPPSVYQLYNADYNFRLAVNREFDVLPNNTEVVYNLPVGPLKTFAKTYYSDRGANIHSDISLDDPLYGISDARGFIQVGSTDFIDTNPDYGGVRLLLEKVPDPTIKAFQELAVQYAVMTNEKGRANAIESMTGINSAFLKDGKVDKSAVFASVASLEIVDMLQDVEKKMEPLIERLSLVTSHADVIGQSLYEHEYITKEEQELLMKELAQVDASLHAIQDTYTDLLHKGPGGITTPGLVLYESLDDVLALVDEVKTLIDSGKALQSTFGDLADTIVTSHSIGEMLEALSSKKRMYIQNGGTTELVLRGSQNGTPIQVNLSATLSMYEKGMKAIEEKQTALQQFEVLVELELSNTYQEERSRTLYRISEMETNPQNERTLLRSVVYAPRNSAKIESVVVHDHLSPLRHCDFTDAYFHLYGHIQESLAFLHRFRQGIEEFFKEDESIAMMFRAVLK